MYLAIHQTAHLSKFLIQQNSRNLYSISCDNFGSEYQYSYSYITMAKTTTAIFVVDFSQNFNFIYLFIYLHKVEKSIQIKCSSSKTTVT